jgi:hypothetical protein
LDRFAVGALITHVFNRAGRIPKSEFRLLYAKLMAVPGQPNLHWSASGQAPCKQAGQEILMNEKSDNFSKELRTKLDEVDKRLKDLKSTAKAATVKANAEAKSQLAALEKRAKDERAKAQAAEAKAKAWLEEKKSATGEKIAAWRAQHDVKKLAGHADSAEQYAAASIQLAVAAVDEAERAAVEAVVARMDADAAWQAAPVKGA